MSYYLVENYDGWMFDVDEDIFISPKGRRAEKPGGVFYGQLSVEDHETALDLAGTQEHNVFYHKHIDNVQFVEPTMEEDDVSYDDAMMLVENAEPVAEETVTVDGMTVHARVYEVGDITINIVDVD